MPAPFATLGGPAAGRLQSSLFHSREARGARRAGMPVATAAPAITGTETVGEELSLSNGTWSNSPTSYAYEWRRDGVLIDGANANTYTLAEADAGAVITGTVRASNASGTSGSTSEGTGEIAEE